MRVNQCLKLIVHLEYDEYVGKGKGQERLASYVSGVGCGGSRRAGAAAGRGSSRAGQQGGAAAGRGSRRAGQRGYRKRQCSVRSMESSCKDQWFFRFYKVSFLRLFSSHFMVCHFSLKFHIAVSVPKYTFSISFPLLFLTAFCS